MDNYVTLKRTVRGHGHRRLSEARDNRDIQRNIHEHIQSDRINDIDHAGPSKAPTQNKRYYNWFNNPKRMLMHVADPTVAAQLIKAGASVNYRDFEGRTPLHSSPNVEITMLLLEHGANINSATLFGDTPLHYARTAGVAACLIDHGADIHSRNIEGETPLHNLDFSCEVMCQPKAILIEKGANIEALDDHGQTPLHNAVQQRVVEAVATLLYYNADTSVRDDYGFTPIMYNYMRGGASQHLIYEMLLGYEYNFSCSANGDPTLLTLALLKKSPYIDEMIGLGVDFSNLRCQLRILLWCIHQPDIEEFKWFWDIFDYEKSWIYCNPILEFLLRKEKYSAFDYVLESPKMKLVIEVQYRNENARLSLHDYDGNDYSSVTRSSYSMHIKESDVKISDVLDAMSLGYDINKAEHAIFILLSYGYEASEEDARRIFDLYGYGPLFELLLHLDLKGTIDFPTSVLEKVLLNPGMDARTYFVSQTHEGEEVDEGVEIEGAYVFDKEFIFMGVGVPSLLELSRNRARVAIWNGYKVQSPSQFYTTVKWMVIPELIKDILNFKVPIYIV